MLILVSVTLTRPKLDHKHEINLNYLLHNRLKMNQFVLFEKTCQCFYSKT